MPKKKTAAKKGKMTKAAFVRSLPEDMPAEEVIAKGKAKGISLNKMAVYKNRSNARKANKSSPSAGAAAKRASANGADTRRGKAPDKKNRVRELKAEHPDWSAAQIAEAAECSINTVYSAWGGSKKRGGSANGTPKPKSPVTHLDHVRALRGVILHVGIDRAKEMMDQIVKDLMV